MVLRGHEGTVYDAGVSPDSAADRRRAQDDTVQVWDRFRRGELVVLRDHEARSMPRRSRRMARIVRRGR